MKNSLLKIALVLLPLFFFAQHAAQAGEMEDEILRLVNQHRAKKRLPSLIVNKAIENASEKHSSNMAKGKVGFGHGGFDGRINGLLKSISGANAGAENVAYGSRTAEDVVRMWLKSSGHRKNIEGKYNLTGIGIAKDRDGTLYYTQIFIRTK